MEIIVDQLNNEIENLVENYKDIISQVNVIENKMNVLTQRIEAHSTNLEEADYEPNDKETLKHIFTTMKCTIDNLDIIRDAKLIHNSTKNRKKVKCRYFNKGYCKFGNKCSFLHPQNITCKQFKENGQCRFKNCDLRHPKNCRYWMKKSEGCKKYTDCKYLHNDKDKFAKRDKVQVEINSEMTSISLESQSKHRDNFRKKI